MSNGSNIFSMFGRSPVKPLQQHMDRVHAAAVGLIPFFDAVLAGDWDTAARIQGEISKGEIEADKMKKELRLHLPKGWLMAMSRRDLLDVLTAQDQIANQAKDVAGIILGRKMVFPEPVAQQLPAFVSRAVDASAQARTAINELDELVETGFSGGEVKVVESMLTELDRIESDTDLRQREIRALVFERESSLPPVDVIFMYRVIEGIGGLADIAQRVGSRLQLMLAR